MIAIVDYGIGNLHSVRKAVEIVGGESLITADPTALQQADKLILPGVGAFKDGMRGLMASGLMPAIQSFVNSGRSLLGICLGMQLLFEQSHEAGQHTGLGILAGQVHPLDPKDLKVPQIGWNQIEISQPSPLFSGVSSSSYVYFNHGYYCQPADNRHILATTQYGRNFASVVGHNRVYGFQFHPEKSQRVGLQLLQNFVLL